MSSNPVTPLDIAPEQVIQFPEGLPGFEDQHRFGLFEQGADSVLYTLQSLDDPAVAFTVADPSVFGFRYDLPVGETDGAALKLETGDEIAVAVIMYKNEGAGVNANLAAPLLINIRNHVAVQRSIPRLSFDVTLRAA